jgi:DNA polymerase-3 subunit beta
MKVGIGFNLYDNSGYLDEYKNGFVVKAIDGRDDSVEFLNGIKRVAVCSNPTTNLIRMDIADNRVNLTAQDIDFSVSANETISCSYEGQNVTIGFKSTFLVEILSNIDTPTVVVELADSTRAGVFKPVYDDKQSSESLMLLMPMMINA